MFQLSTGVFSLLIYWKKTHSHLLQNDSGSYPFVCLFGFCVSIPQGERPLKLLDVTPASLGDFLEVDQSRALWQVGHVGSDLRLFFKKKPQIRDLRSTVWLQVQIEDLLLDEGSIEDLEDLILSCFGEDTEGVRVGRAVDREWFSNVSQHLSRAVALVLETTSHLRFFF